MKKKEKLLGCLILLILVVFVFIGVLQSRKPTAISENEIKAIFAEESNTKNGDAINLEEGNKGEKENSSKNSFSEEKIIVEIKGEVKKPNVYELALGSRINDLIEIAGGVTENANLNNINRASELKDGDCIIIEDINIKSDNNENDILHGINKETIDKESSEKVNINLADKSKLMTLTGVGDTKAENIIAYRETENLIL